MADREGIRSGVPHTRFGWAIFLTLLVVAGGCQEGAIRERTDTPAIGARAVVQANAGTRAPQSSDAQRLSKVRFPRERVGPIYTANELPKEVDCAAARSCVREQARRHRLFKETWIDTRPIEECLGAGESEQLRESLTCGSFDIGPDPRFGDAVIVKGTPACHGCVCGGVRLNAYYKDMSERRCRLLGMKAIGSGERYEGCRPWFNGQRRRSCDCAPSDLMCAMKCAADTPRRRESEPQAPTGMATLKVDSLPPANVLLDGRPIGLTPRVGLQVRPGAHTIVFVRRSDRKVMTVELLPGEKRLATVRF